jgi:signal transduction histidine kinase
MASASRILPMSRRFASTVTCLVLLWLALAASHIAVRATLGASWLRVDAIDQKNAYRIRHAFGDSSVTDGEILIVDSTRVIVRQSSNGRRLLENMPRPLRAEIAVQMIEHYWGVWLFVLIYGTVGIITYALQPGYAATRAFVWSAFCVLSTNLIDMLGPDALDITTDHRVLIIEAARTLTAFGSYTGILLFATNIGRIEQPAQTQSLFAHLIIAATGVLVGGLAAQFIDNPSPPRVLAMMWNIVGALTLPTGIIIATIRRNRLESASGRQQLQILTLGSLLVATLNVGLTRLPTVLQLPPLISANVGITLDAIFPLSLALAVIRNRLFAIDITVVRVLSYVLVSTSIAALYIGLIAVTTYIYGASGRLISAITAGIVIAVLFTPMRTALNSVAARIVYGARGDPNANIIAISRLISAKLPPEVILNELVASLPQFFPVTGASITSTRGGLTYAALSNSNARSDMTTLPLIYRGESVGALSLFSSQPLRTYDRQALEAVAQQATLVLINAELEFVQRQHARELSLARKQELLLIRRQLHDDVLPTLDSARHTIENASQNLDDDNAPTIARLLDAEAILRLAQQSIRDMAYRLWPPALEVMGLSPAIGHLIKAHQLKNPAIQYHFVACELARLDNAMEFVVYRMVEQCLTNAAQHAKAATIHVNVRRQQGYLEVDVIDDGKGLHGVVEGVGLQNLRAMAAELGGTFALSANLDGPGACAQLRAPLVQSTGQNLPFNGTV